MMDRRFREAESGTGCQVAHGLRGQMGLMTKRVEGLESWMHFWDADLDVLRTDVQRIGKVSRVSGESCGKDRVMDNSDVRELSAHVDELRAVLSSTVLRVGELIERVIALENRFAESEASQGQTVGSNTSKGDG